MLGQNGKKKKSQTKPTSWIITVGHWVNQGNEYLLFD